MAGSCSNSSNTTVTIGSPIYFVILETQKNSATPNFMLIEKF